MLRAPLTVMLPERFNGMPNDKLFNPPEIVGRVTAVVPLVDNVKLDVLPPIKLDVPLKVKTGVAAENDSVLAPIDKIPLVSVKLPATVLDAFMVKVPDVTVKADTAVTVLENSGP